MADETNRPIITIKDVLFIFYLFGFRYLVTFFPVKVIHLIGVPLRHIYRLLCVRSIPFLQNKLYRAYGGLKTRKDIKMISYRFIDNAVNRAMDDMILTKPQKQDLIEKGSIIGLEYLKTALLSGKGVMLISGHFYCNRVAKYFLGEIGLPVMSVRNSLPRDLLVGKLGAKYLKRRYVKFLEPVIKDEVFIQDKSLSLKILKHLRENGLVNIHIDASFSYHLEDHSFLGRRRSFPTGFLRIASLTECAIVPMACIGNSTSFTVVFEKGFVPKDTSGPKNSTKANLSRLVEVLEKQILEFPDQWELWIRL